MRVVKLILIACVVLLINNLVLLNYIGYFSDEKESVGNSQQKQQSRSDVDANNGQSSSKLAMQDTKIEEDLPVRASTRVIDETQMIGLLRNVAETEEFIEIFDNYQTKAGQRYLELQKKFGSMNAFELYDVIQNSDRARDKQYALQILGQSNFGELETHQIKDLLNIDSLQNWHKGKLISNLLERQDAEALDLAKDYMTTGSSRMYMNQELVRGVYDLDPQFIKQYVDEMDLDKGHEAFSILSVAMEDPKMAKEFLAKNFDRIVDSKNNELFNYLGYSSEIDLSDGQQNKLVEMFQSPARQKRRFALGMISSIKNLDTLRQAYQEIQRDNDKRSFIYALVGVADKPERKQLAKELSASFDDPRLNKLFQ